MNDKRVPESVLEYIPTGRKRSSTKDINISLLKDAQVSFFFLIFSVDKHVQNFVSLCNSLECFKKNTVRISYG